MTATAALPGLTLLDFPNGSGTILPATARGTYLISIWSAGSDATALVNKGGPGEGNILSIAYSNMTSAELGWVDGALVVTTSAAVHRYGTTFRH